MIKKKQALNFFYDNAKWFFLILPMIFVVIFNYIPMFGLIMAFQDFNIFAGSNSFEALFASEFVGLENFITLFESEDFIKVLLNTIEISLMKIIFVFPVPIILAILLNELRNQKFLRISQTILYLPHFLSWVIVGGIWMNLLGSAGSVNSILMNIGLISEPIPFLIDDILFRVVILLSDAWKEMGWSTIIYLAAITSIDYSLYEAIKMDGGSKWQEITKVTIPCIATTILMMFILRMASIMDAGFDQIFNLYSPSVYEGNDVLSTYIYRMGITAGEYSISTAMGLFNSIIGCCLMLSANKLIKKYTNKSIW